MAESKKVDLSKESVAYFDQGVEAAGFYLLEGEPSESEVAVTEGDQLYDDDDNPIVLPNGRMAVGSWDGDDNFVPGSSYTGEKIKVKHESSMKPGTRVYPSPDGEGFVKDDPEGGEG